MAYTMNDASLPLTVLMLFIRHTIISYAPLLIVIQFDFSENSQIHAKSAVGCANLLHIYSVKYRRMTDELQDKYWAVPIEWRERLKMDGTSSFFFFFLLSSAIIFFLLYLCSHIFQSKSRTKIKTKSILVCIERRVEQGEWRIDNAITEME